MEKSEMIEMLDRAKGRMTDREEKGRSCMMAIIEALGYIIERLDVEADTAQQMAAVEDSGTKSEKKPVKKRNIVDYGKIVALYKAGWSQKKIGEEMGVSPTSISMALKRYKDKIETGFIWDPEERKFVKKE